MRFLRGSKAEEKSKRARVEDLLKEAGLRVDEKGNIRHGDLIIGSLTQAGQKVNFVYPPRHELLPGVKVAQDIILFRGGSAKNNGKWEPNS